MATFPFSVYGFISSEILSLPYYVGGGDDLRMLASFKMIPMKILEIEEFMNKF